VRVLVRREDGSLSVPSPQGGAAPASARGRGEGAGGKEGEEEAEAKAEREGGAVPPPPGAPPPARRATQRVLFPPAADGAAAAAAAPLSWFHGTLLASGASGPGAALSRRIAEAEAGGAGADAAAPLAAPGPAAAAAYHHRDPAYAATSLLLSPSAGGGRVYRPLSRRAAAEAGAPPAVASPPPSVASPARSAWDEESGDGAFSASLAAAPGAGASVSGAADAPGRSPEVVVHLPGGARERLAPRLPAGPPPRAGASSARVLPAARDGLARASSLTAPADRHSSRALLARSAAPGAGAPPALRGSRVAPAPPAGAPPGSVLLLGASPLTLPRRSATPAPANNTIVP